MVFFCNQTGFKFKNLGIWFWYHFALRNGMRNQNPIQMKQNNHTGKKNIIPYYSVLPCTKRF